MKKFKKLIPALCMLLISAVLMGTSTYAWFSMNTKVVASGMQVTAQSNSTYLLITNESSKTGATATDLTASYTFTDTQVKAVYPTAKAAAEIKKGEETLVAAGKWYTCNNEKSDAATGKETNYTVLTTDWDTNYFVKYTVYLTLSKDSENWSGSLNVKMTRNGDADASVSCVVVVNNEELNFTGTSLNGTISEVDLTKNTTQAVDVYLYINGTSENVKSDFINNAENANKLGGKITLDIELGTKKAA